MFPLKKRQLIRGANAHVKAGLGIGADYVANYDMFYIPFDGVVETYYGKEGGNWLRLTRPNGDKIEFAHLSQYAARDGAVKEGQPGGVTGNTGSITTGPHLHIQIFNKQGKRLDPETYPWTMYKQTIFIIENKVNHAVVQAILDQSANYFEKVTNGEFILEFKTIVTDQNFNTIKSKGLGGYYNELVDIDIVDPAQIRAISSNNPTVLFFNSLQVPVPPNHPANNGDVSQIAITPNITLPSQTEVLTETFVHELLHNWFWTLKVQDTTHQHAGIYDPRPDANFSHIILQLKPRWAELSNHMANQAKIVKSKFSNIVYICYPIPSETHLAERVSLEGLTLPSPIPDTDSLI